MAMRDALLPEFDQAMANTSNGDKQSEKPSRKRCHLRTTAPAAWQPRVGFSSGNRNRALPKTTAKPTSMEE